ncbi:MAG: GNAT family N-acetyltransferase [Sphingobacteriales bacterium]|nr:MAG: GNAT family N-acetyltransferase [Sphingobacteriales bacterium]
MNISIRSIQKEDNKPLAEMIRTVFREFKIDQPGTVYTDPTTDNLYELFQTAGSAYWVAAENALILGGCGIYPTQGLPEGCAELVKFYVSAAIRGKGFGKNLMQKSINSAKEMGYKQLYLESLPELGKAVGMYEKAGFRMLQKPLGDSGHFACTIWMMKELE